MKTYIIIIDGFMFVDDLTPAEAAALATDDTITIKEVKNA